MSTLVFLSPQAIVRERVVEGGISPRLKTLASGVIAIVENGFAGSDYYMRGVESRLNKAYSGAKTQYWLKPMLSHPSPISLLEEICAASDAVVIGVGG